MLKTDTIRTLILDEGKNNNFVALLSNILFWVDELLSRGFEEQVYDIYKALPYSVQVGLFSTTIYIDTLRLIRAFTKDPVVVLRQHKVTLEGIRQYYINVEKEEWKIDTLCDLYSSINITPCVIYCNTSKKVNWLAEQLQARDFTLSVLVRSLFRRK